MLNNLMDLVIEHSADISNIEETLDEITAAYLSNSFININKVCFSDGNVETIALEIYKFKEIIDKPIFTDSVDNFKMIIDKLGYGKDNYRVFILGKYNKYDVEIRKVPDIFKIAQLAKKSVILNYNNINISNLKDIIYNAVHKHIKVSLFAE